MIYFAVVQLQEVCEANDPSAVDDEVGVEQGCPDETEQGKPEDIETGNEETDVKLIDNLETSLNTLNETIVEVANDNLQTDTSTELVRDDSTRDILNDDSQPLDEATTCAETFHEDGQKSDETVLEKDDNFDDDAVDAFLKIGAKMSDETGDKFVVDADQWRAQNDEISAMKATIDRQSKTIEDILVRF